MTMASLILIPVISGIILYKIPIKIGKVLLMLIQLYLSCTAIFLLLKSKAGESMYEVLGGENPILYIGLQGDRVALVFVCLAVFLFTATFIYTLKDKFFDNKFMLLFLVLQGVLIGIFLADDLFNLFVLLEVSTVVAIILIMFKKDGRAIYDGLFYLIIQIISMLFFLFGIAYMYKIFGVLSMAEISNVISEVPSETLLLPFAFLLTGVCVKIGFFPLFSWVSHAYGAPSTPFAVLAILSGLSVKSSLFLFIRLNNLFYPALDYTRFFLALAVLTGVVGFMKALAQTNLKLILAYSTISQIGLIAVGFFIPSDISYWGSMYHILNHAMLKSLLFLTTGMIVEAYKTSNVHAIRGVWKRMPVVAVVTLVALFGVTGAPLFNGSISKYWIVAGSSGSIIEAAIWMINIGTMLTYVKYASILFGKSDAKTQTDGTKTGVILFLGAICLLGGIFGTQVVRFLFDVELSIQISDYLSKGLIYVVMVIGCIIFYRVVISKFKVFHRFVKYSLTLHQSAVALLAFFTSLIIYGIWSS